ncbi:receptor-type tyrosine-protein phosphatase eta [Paramisgurnus dabryanus]|uniref:receptor-type tyrosine-protein phosphatase eta n=1 Tax=Paramisgurnus dabryanus TaxID=90735 RepID=UPI003CCF3758
MTINETTKNTFIKINHLMSGLQYLFKVYAVAADNVTEGSCNQIFLYIDPDVIRNLAVTEITTSSAFLTWNEPVGIRHFFRVHWIGNKLSRNATTNLTSYNINDLNAGVSYRFCVTVVVVDNSREGQAVCMSKYTRSFVDNIGMAVGIGLGVFCFILTITVIYWRIYKKKTNSDTPMHAMRSLPLTQKVYEEYFKEHADFFRFEEEYEVLKAVGTAQSRIAALIIENEAKNRYVNVLPYDASRVKLSICCSPFDDYINANYIPGYNFRKEFIAAQGPLPNTVNEFWRMIWEQDVYTLVMLTKCNEQGQVKCEKYWPCGTNHYDNISVTTIVETVQENWTTRDFTIKNVKTAETRNVRQFQLTTWPHHRVPQSTELLIDFRHLVREHIDQQSSYSPTVVHCSAGVGRTGTFIAIDCLILKIEKESMVDVYGIVHDMHLHRPFMVQSKDQYVYLHQCAYDIIRSRAGPSEDITIYQNMYSRF